MYLPHLSLIAVCRNNVELLKGKELNFYEEAYLKSTLKSSSCVICRSLLSDINVSEDTSLDDLTVIELFNEQKSVDAAPVKPASVKKRRSLGTVFVYCFFFHLSLPIEIFFYLVFHVSRLPENSIIKLQFWIVESICQSLQL